MTIKTKLSLGLGFLFIVILLLGGLGTFYLYRLSNESKIIITANYESIVFAKKMMKALDELEIDPKSSIETFETNLTGQEKNLTEKHEREITLEIRNEYQNLKLKALRNDQKLLLRQKLQQLMEVNLQAIWRKSEVAQKTADTAIVYMSTIATIAVLLSFSFIVSFPGFIANPIRVLTESIREIANKNYSKRLFFQSNDEFGELAKAFNAMAHKLDEYENSNVSEIIFQKKRIETIINSIHEPIIGLDENKNILFANHEALVLIGTPESKLVGKYAPDIALENDIFRSLLKDEPNSKPLMLLLDSKEVYFTKETLDIKAENKLIGQAIVLKNITEFKELDSAKTNFIATISHELKTPIASIKMGLKLLEDERIGETNDQQKKLIHGIREDSQRLLKITSELLDLTQVESGKINLIPQPTHPREVIDYALEAVQFQAEQKDISLSVQSDENLPLLYLDKEKTAWVLVNLIANAIRHSPEGTQVLVKAIRLPKQVSITVRDYGKGIDPKFKDKIFDKYFKIPDSDGAQGTGLGLAICKEFIQAQGGNITMYSVVGEGTSFSLQFDV